MTFTACTCTHLQRSNCTFIIWMTLFSRETTASKSFCATVCAPMMAITDSNSTRICLNHSSYTEGRRGMEKAGMVWKNGLVGWMGAWQEIVYDMYSSYTCSVHLDGSDVAVYSLHMHAGTTQSHPPTHPHTLMYDYEEVLIVNSLPANFFASQSLCWENLIQLKVRTIVHFLPFRALTTRGVKENDTNARTGYHRDNIAIYLMCRLRLVMGVALAS